MRKYSDSGDCFLEVKSKNNKGTTDKKRMPVSNLSDNLNEEQYKFLAALSHDQTSNLQTSLKNEFQRITLVSEESHERVTIDFLIHFQNNGNEKVLNETVVAEVKQEQHFHKSGFRQLMQDERIFPASFSKYCMGTLLTHPGIKYNRFKSKLLTLNKINDGVA